MYESNHLFPARACVHPGCDIRLWSTLTGPIANPGNGHFYYLLSQDTWTGAEAEAVALGGHLATINDLGENNWVMSAFGTFGGVQRALWIGLTDAGHEGTFTWTDGEALAFTYWELGQPDNGGPGEDWVQLLPPAHYAAGQWNDFQNLNVVDYADVPLFGVPVNGVVEVVPEPSAAWLVLPGCVAFSFWRTRKAP